MTKANPILGFLLIYFLTGSVFADQQLSIKQESKKVAIETVNQKIDQALCDRQLRKISNERVTLPRGELSLEDAILSASDDEVIIPFYASNEYAIFNFKDEVWHIVKGSEHYKDPMVVKEHPKFKQSPDGIKFINVVFIREKRMSPWIYPEPSYSKQFGIEVGCVNSKRIKRMNFLPLDYNIDKILWTSDSQTAVLITSYDPKGVFMYILRFK